MSSMFGNMGSRGNRGPSGNSTDQRMQSGGGISGDVIPKGYKSGQLQQFTPEQMQLFSQLFGHVSPDSQTGRLASGDQSMFGEIEAPALRQFQELQGQLGSRFSGMGGLGARKSSGFQNTMNSAASNFAQELQSNRQNLMRQALQDLMGYSGELLGQRPQENFLIKKQQNPWVDIAGKFAGAIPGAVAGYMTGGPAGAASGAASGFSGFGGGQNQFPLTGGYDQQFRQGGVF